MLVRQRIVKHISKQLIRNFTTQKMDEKTKSIVAICQLRATNNKKENLEKVTKLIEEAKTKCAKFVFLPECCDYVGEHREETLKLSEPLTGPTVEAYKALAKYNDVWLFLGGIHEAILKPGCTKPEKIYNAHVVIDNCGEIVKVYRKLHLFDVSTPDMNFMESSVVEKGCELVPPVKTPFGHLGLLICYDIRFPEASTLLAKQGAQILTYPAAFAYSTGKAHWEILLRSRAIENQCFVIAPAQIGFHNKKRQSYGHGMIVDAWGKILAELDEKRENDVAVAEIDTNSLVKIRNNMPCFRHRRSDVYNLISLASQPIRVDRKFSEFTIDKETIFYESEYCFAFTNIRCVVPGHVLVASKRSCPRLTDLDEDEVSDMFQSVMKIQKIIEPIYGAESVTITVQDGPDAGQTVKHVHFHIMPRKKGDFEYNDMIYIELNRHDHSPTTPERSLAERISEAEIYRKYLYNVINF